MYVSVRFRIASHNCFCGCGNEVVTNLSPRGWQLTYDGESISLYPSIGNWDFKCRSHYWITRNTVRWAEKWSDEKIRRARSREGNPKSTEPSDVTLNRRKDHLGAMKAVWTKIKRLGR